MLDYEAYLDEEDEIMELESSYLYSCAWWLVLPNYTSEDGSLIQRVHNDAVRGGIVFW